MRGSQGVGLALLLALILSGRPVAAEGGPEFSILLRPSLSFVDSQIAEGSENFTHQQSTDFLANYRLTMRHELFPLLRYSVSGLFDQRDSWIIIDGDRQRLNLYGGNAAGIVSVGGPRFGADLSYVWRRIAVPEQIQVSQILSTVARLAPVDLPKLDLRYSHSTTYDIDRRLQDSTTNDFQATLSYRRANQLDARYLFGLQAISDRLSQIDSQAMTHSGRVNLTRAFWGGRLSVTANYALDARQSSHDARSPDALLASQRIPMGGLSLVDELLAQPTKNTLVPNISLIDGDVDASAAINIGFGAPDHERERNIGAAFADVSVDINMLYVSVDRALSPEARQFRWAVYVSEDNIDWVPVAQRAPVVYNEILRRFEIAIDRTRAKNFKVVTTPLSTAATADQRFRDIFVTEFQLYLVVRASEAPADQSDLVHTLQATAIARLTESGSLQADVSLRAVLFQLPVLRFNYRATEGLTYQRAWRQWSIRGRVARDDYDEGTGSLGGLTWLASTVYSPWQALRHSLVYNGSHFSRNGTTTIHTLNLFNRADIYPGISLLYSAGGTLTYPGQESDQLGVSSRAGISLEPHRTLKLSGSYNYQKTRYLDADAPRKESFSDFLHGSLAFTPLPAFSVSAQVSHVRSPKARFLADFSVNVAPFPDGNLRMSANYSESLDPTNEALTRRATAALRWNFAVPLILDSSFSYLWAENGESWNRSYVVLTMLTARL